MQNASSPEKQAQNILSTEHKNFVVTQPEKIGELLNILSVVGKVEERIGEDISGDLGGGGSTGGATTGDDDGTSVRAQAIAALPQDAPEIRKQLGGYIQKEIKSLRKQVRKQAFRASKPGSAHQMNELYGKIRRLQSLLTELMDVSLDVLRRLAIKVFVDKQSI